jgi:hypothetical protein
MEVPYKKSQALPVIPPILYGRNHFVGPLQMGVVVVIRGHSNNMNHILEPFLNSFVNVAIRQNQMFPKALKHENQAWPSNFSNITAIIRYFQYLNIKKSSPLIQLHVYEGGDKKTVSDNVKEGAALSLKSLFI